MTKVTLQAFPARATATWRGTLHGGQNSDALWNGIVALHSGWAKHISPSGGTGYITGSAVRTGKISVTVHFPGALTTADLESKMKLVESEIHRAAGNGRVNFTGVAHLQEPPTSSLTAPIRAFDGPDVNSARETTFPGNGENKIIASWLYGYKELTNPRLKEVLRASQDVDSMVYQDMTSGPGVAKPPYIRGGGNAVNPGWRQALGRAATEMNWAGTNVRTLAKRKSDALKMDTALRSLAPEMGTYVNEADPDMPDVQKAFWGTNYPRLLTIKQKYDPKGVFWCKPCVGGELWVEKERGGLCKK
jgi:hypothetical protein